MSRRAASDTKAAGATTPARAANPAWLAVLSVLALIVATLPAHAGDQISVQLDRAKIMRIARPASTVILGNPAIADATIQDRQTLIITGRSFGTTNLIVLDKDGQPVADELLTVTSPDENVVTIYQGKDRQSFSCAPECQPMMNLGDTVGFDAVKGQVDARNSLVQGANGPN